MDTNTATLEHEVDDIDISPPQSNGDYEVIPAGVYDAKLVGFKESLKPDWKVVSDREKYPDKVEDLYEWVWSFELDVDGEKRQLRGYTSRTWHEKSNGAKFAATLLGKPKLDGRERTSTRKLIGLPCQLWVVESEKGTNYIKQVLPAKKRNGKAAPRPEPEEEDILF
jgi:hypothetical protein